ncbi:Asp-tRNA(Asn)/Glu-tRNA(Gln) amidotransferase GatCAB subunit A [bacterium]|nr:MAG: Asp-tRNA(Asn)/Glu-tRNA(Gln) amidotransferase GatCAB subunit A [bacterium]
MEIVNLFGWEIKEKIERGEISEKEVFDAFYERASSSSLNTFITLAEWREEKKEGKLRGIPFGIKDNILVKGMKNTCGSRILHDFIAPYDATCIERLKKEGGVILGKTNMDEFAMGSSNEYSAFGPVKNPFDPERVPGGSSGGSAAAVANLEVPIALGSDTGGSVRQPAAFCGVFGLKPTYGRISRYGLVAFASSLDQIGIIARTVKDIALTLEVIAGYDPMDSTSSPEGVPPYSKIIEEPCGYKTLGVPEELISGCDEEILNAFQRTLEILQRLGHKIVRITLPHAKYYLPTYEIIAMAEASSNLARYDGVRYGLRVEGESAEEIIEKTRMRGFGPEVKRRIMVGTYVLSKGYREEYYGKAQRVRTIIKEELEEALREVDFIITPTAPFLPFKLGERKEDPIKMYLSDVFTVFANLAGLPAISIPGGRINGLPWGFQVTGRAWDEENLLTFAYHLEREGGWSLRQ